LQAIALIYHQIAAVYKTIRHKTIHKCYDYDNDELYLLNININ